MISYLGHNSAPRMSNLQDQIAVTSSDISTPGEEIRTNPSFEVTEEWQISDNWTPLHAAADTLDIYKIRSILSTTTYSINATTKETHETPLHKAVQSCDDEFGGDKIGIIRLLVSHGADLNPHDCVGNTPLHYAAKGGFLDAVETLIELGAVVDVDNKELESRDGACGCGNGHGLAGLLSGLTGGRFSSGKFREFSTPLHVAASAGHADAVKLLLEKGAKVDSFDIDDGTPLTCGVLGRSLEVCRTLLEWPGGLASVGVKQKQGHLPIHYAGVGNPAVLRLLIEKGVDVDVQIDQPDCWSHGRTALSAACEEKYNMDMIEENVRILLEAGADPNRQLGRKGTPFLLALSSGNVKAARLILEKGLADLGSATLANEAPLLVAATRGQAQMCEFLIEKGCDVNMRTSYGDEYTPLHNAAGYGNAETANVLIAAGADIEARNFDGRRPLHMACFKGKVECVRELLRAAADIQAVDDSSWTPLHFAANYGHVQVVEMLLNPEGRKPALLNKRTTGGQGGGNCTAADLGKLCGYDNIVEILVAAGDMLSAEDDELIEG
ncbi:ankyrin repeat-containing domain protein [Cadophora sp. MPI-SDFR-AT-0126]|nr:ankyrin repeat-containing domain protein [Leotiomycetes sp. MPI-SDFR-AT-0126]